MQAPEAQGRVTPEGRRAEELCHQQSAVRSLPSEEASRAFSASGPLFLECVVLTFGPITAFYRSRLEALHHFLWRWSSSLPLPDGLGFCLSRAVTSASQGKVPMLTTGPASRGGVLANPPPAGGPAQKPPGNGVAGGPGVPTAVVSAAHVQTSPQAKVLLHVSGQMTVNQARSAARTGGHWARALGEGPEQPQTLCTRGCEDVKTV